ncbi:MAG: hypothetical protein B7Y39_00595 [Bdellovibrio sp. 28-41-41]|nr:MAG: hypothetical protein B7Y39_00595 [Bdellovibrio sp. 28-41-41]
MDLLYRLHIYEFGVCKKYLRKTIEFHKNRITTVINFIYIHTPTSILLKNLGVLSRKEIIIVWLIGGGLKRKKTQNQKKFWVF